MFKKTPGTDTIDELTQDWQDEASRLAEETIDELEKHWSAKILPENEILIINNSPVITSFVMRRESASLMPGIDPEMILAHNIPRGDDS